MGRELRRVPLDFSWPLEKTWEGFLNPLHVATKCEACDGSGYSPESRRLKAMWYGYVPFRPEDRGSVPFTTQDEAVLAFARRNIAAAPSYYGRDANSLVCEASRLCDLWNAQWSHHLNADDVAALLEAGRLVDFTHTWEGVTGWTKKDAPYIPTPQEVNTWSLSGIGHDSINQWVCVRAECERLGVPTSCVECDGKGEKWPSEEAEQAYEDWKPTPPPTGDGYQIWETVSEGSPISPVFSTPEALARHMAGTTWGADHGSSYETWMAFINGSGWAPSMIHTPATGVISGIEGVVALGNK